MTNASFTLPTSIAFDDATIQERLTVLLDAYGSVGKDLDLFTSGDFDSPDRFEIANELEMGLILLVSSIQANFPDDRPLRALDCLESAERLTHGARWLNEMADRLKPLCSCTTLPSKLRLFADGCQEIANHLWWRWLCSFEPTHASTPTRLGLGAASRVESVSLGV